MPVISPPRRYSSNSTSSNSYLPPSVGGHTSNLLSKTSGTSSSFSSGYRSGSLYNPITGSTYTSSGIGSSYYRSSLSSYRPSSFYDTSSSVTGSSLLGRSSYRYYSNNNNNTSSYLTGGNNDSTSTSSSNRFGVSKLNSNKYSRSSSNKETASGSRKPSIILQSSSSSDKLNKITQNSNNNNNTSYTKTQLNTTSPTISRSESICKKSLSDRKEEKVTSKSDHNHDIKSNNDDFKIYEKKFTKIKKSSVSPSSKSCGLESSYVTSKSQQTDRDTITKTETGQKDTINTKPSSLINSSIKSKNNSLNSNFSSSALIASSSVSSIPCSLARQVATSGLDIYEKYSPSNYIPKCELSRSRSLSEATTTTTTTSSTISTTKPTFNILNNNSYNNNNTNNNKSSNNDNFIKSSSLSNNIDDNCNINDLLQNTKDNLKLDDNTYLNLNKKIIATKISSSPLTTTESSSVSILSSLSSASLLSSSPKENSLTTNIKIRNVSSTRSVLPSSPTPSRYWDRENRTSILSTRKLSTDTEDLTKTRINNSSISYDKDSHMVEGGLCGLKNIGNTCFMNSVIQCLSHTKELTKFLRAEEIVHKPQSTDNQILVEFAKLIREMWSPHVRSVTPSDLKIAFSFKHRMYSGHSQQDAQEFLRFFLDSLHCGLNTGVKREPLKIDESLSDNEKADLTWKWYSKIEKSVIKDLFVGQLKSTLRCTSCNNTSVTFDPFWDLSVSLPSSSKCKLDSCLDLFIREEILDGDEMPTCSKCKIRRRCTKSFSIQRFPKYLVIHLKRFSETRWSKLSNLVEFPTGEKELNMASYASNPSANALYSLYAISNHMGSTAGGHYVALCKHPFSKKWHEFNDNIVSNDLSESVLVSPSAYLLFYERV